MNNDQYLGKKFRVIHDCSEGFEHGTITTCTETHDGVLGLKNTAGKCKAFYFNSLGNKDEVELVESDVVEEFGGFILPSPKELAERCQIDVMALAKQLNKSFREVSEALQFALFEKGFEWRHGPGFLPLQRDDEQMGMCFNLYPDGVLTWNSGKGDGTDKWTTKKEQTVRTSVVERTSVVLTVPPTPVVAVEGGNYTKQQLLRLLEELEAK